MTTAYAIYKEKWDCDKEKFDSVTNAALQKADEEIWRVRSNIEFVRNNYYIREHGIAVMRRMTNESERELELWKTIRQAIEEIGNRFYDKCNTELSIIHNQALLSFPRVLHISPSWRDVLKEYFDTIDFKYQIEEHNLVSNSEVWLVEPIIREVREIKYKREDETEWHTKRG